MIGHEPERWQVVWKAVLGASTSLSGTGASRRAEAGPYDVLLLDAASRQSLASLRSFGQAGLRVAVGECFAECDPDLPVLAFRSRYSARNVVLPSFANDGCAFAEAVVEFVREHPTRVVLPASDGAIAALIVVRERLAELGCLLALPSDQALEVANDKGRTLEIAASLDIRHPRTMVVEDLSDLPSMLEGFAFPIVLKPTRSWAHRSSTRLQAVEVIDEPEAVAATKTFLAAGAGVLAQHWVGGRREGVTLFLVDGDVRACFAHLEHRTTPALGGASVVRESIPMSRDVYDASVSLVTALGLEGLSEVEFRRDADGHPLLMEINARLAGPVEIARRSGVDFPLMVWQWATGVPVDPVATYVTGVRMRWLRGDMRWLRDNHHRAGRPDSLSRRRALWTFCLEFLRSTHYDCFDRRDLSPVVAELRTTLGAVRRRTPRPPRAVNDTYRTGTSHVS